MGGYGGGSLNSDLSLKRGCDKLQVRVCMVYFVLPCCSKLLHLEEMPPELHMGLRRIASGVWVLRFIAQCGGASLCH